MTKLTPAVSVRATVLATGTAAVLALAGCGSAADDAVGGTTISSSSSSSSSSSTSSASSSPSSSPTSSSPSLTGRTLEITVTGRTVDPAPATVRLRIGESLTLRVTSDHDNELHVHGLDVDAELTAGVTESVTLTGKDPGVFEVETHHPELRLLKIAVQ